MQCPSQRRLFHRAVGSAAYCLCVLSLLSGCVLGQQKCVYIAQEGDSAAQIAADQGCEEAAIRVANRAAGFNPLLTGQILFLPEDCTCPPPRPCNLTVAEDATAYTIANDRGCRVADLAAANPGINMNELPAGEMIVIPTESCRCEKDIVGCQYVVAPGEYLLDIAATLSCGDKAIEDLVAVNPGLDPNFLLNGQKLVLPPTCDCPGSLPTAAPAPAAREPVATPAQAPEAAAETPPATGASVDGISEQGGGGDDGGGTNWVIVIAGVSAAVLALVLAAAVAAVLLLRRRGAARKNKSGADESSVAPDSDENAKVASEGGVPRGRLSSRGDMFVVTTPYPSSRSRPMACEPLTMQSQSVPSASEAGTRTPTRTRERTGGTWSTTHTGPPVSGSNFVDMSFITDESGSTNPTAPRLGARYSVQTTNDTRITTLPTLSQPSYNESIEYLQDVLDDLHRQSRLLSNRWAVLSPNERRIGGQGVVQFIWDTRTRQDHVAKFFLNNRTFEREAQLYGRPQVREMMAAVVHLQEAGLLTPDGDELPSFIVLKRGSSLDEWALKRQPDFPTSLQVLMQIVGRLAALHAAGLVHRDLKPANILWRTDDNDWTIIDFGCVADLSEGNTANLACSLPYAPPEIAMAVEAGETTISVDTASDVWSLGVVVYELLTCERVFPRSQDRSTVLAQLTGKEPLPWEEGAPEERRRKVRRLGVLRRSVLSCLSRTPAHRPSASSLLAALNSLFQETQSKTAESER